MTIAATVAQDLTTAGFVALGAAVAYRWYQDRNRTHGMLALALICLAIVTTIGRLQDVLHPSPVLAAMSIVAFILSGYFVLLFRNEFIPLGRTLRRGADVLLGLGIIVGFVYVAAPTSVVAHTLLGLAAVSVWAVLTGEPVVRFWLASRDLTAVQRARMRFLSLGFGILIAILFVAVLGGSALSSPTAIVVTQLFALVSVPAIYVSFAPPSVVRRLWRMPEENELRAAMQDLLIFSPTREEMAERAAFWAMRLVGASAAFIVDADGKVIANIGVDRSRAAVLASTREPSPRGPGAVIKAPLHLGERHGALGVVAGTFTPIFGSAEISQLNAYANSVSAGLQRVRVTERMAAIERNKSQFLNLASHELRGPITVIRGYLSMLEGGMLGQLNERGRQAASVMAAKVSEMNELIEEMIDAARLEEGGLQLRLAECDLRDVARAAADVVAPLVDPSHRLTLDLPDRRVMANVDIDRTTTIITNLLSNAIKYSPAGGEVTCQVRARAGIARISVSDEGLGISRDNMATLFTRFGRIVTPQTEHLKGTGLGLFLSRQLARLQGGEITVTSIEGKGSTFTLQLPVVTAAAAAERAERSHDGHAGAGADADADKTSKSRLRATQG